MKEETRELSIGQALDLGKELAMIGNATAAETMFRGVLRHEPLNFEATEQLGSILFEQKKYHEALYWFWRGRKIDRKHPLALTNYGLCVSQLGHPDEGLEDLQRAVYHAEKSKTATPEAMSLIYNNLGNTLERLNRHEEALIPLNKGISINPKDAFPRYNRGIVLLRLNRHEEAIRDLDISLDLDPRNADARYNRSMGHLLLGHYKEGFEGYEFRLMTSSNTAPNLGLPAERKWQGGSLAGKRILVHAEQGLGDELQFLRFLPLLQAKQPGEVLMICHNPVRPFVEQIPGITVLDPHTEVGDRYDVWVALMSLPHYLRIEREDQIPAPLLPKVEEERVGKWFGDLVSTFSDIARLHVGVVWAGQFQHKNDSHRSIPLQQFAKLFDTEGVNFVSLQQMRPGETEEFAEIKRRHSNVRALWLDDLRDTAAVIEGLDVVVSADTAVAHLAASMGKPTFILIPKFGTDWRWQLERTDSPWYPSATLYRQSKIGDWASVIARLRNDLTGMAARQVAA